MVYSRRGRHLLSCRAIELDLVRTVGSRGEATRQCAIGVRRQWHRRAIRHHEPPASRGHRRLDSQAHVSPLESGNVAPVLDGPRFQSRIRGEVILEVQLFDVRQFDNLQGEGARLDPGGLDVVLEPLREIEQHPVVRAVFGSNHWEALILGLWRFAHHDDHIASVEAVKGCRNGLIRAFRNGGVSGRHVDAIRRGRFDVTRHHQQRRERMTEIGRPECKQRHGGDRDDRRCARVATDRQPLDAATFFNLLRSLDGCFDEAPDQRWRGVA